MVIQNHLKQCFSQVLKFPDAIAKVFFFLLRSVEGMKFNVADRRYRFHKNLPNYFQKISKKWIFWNFWWSVTGRAEHRARLGSPSARRRQTHKEISAAATVLQFWTSKKWSFSKICQTNQKNAFSVICDRPHEASSSHELAVGAALPKSEANMCHFFQNFEIQKSDHFQNFVKIKNRIFNGFRLFT